MEVGSSVYNYGSITFRVGTFEGNHRLSSYQFLVLRLRLLPIYVVVDVVVFLLSLIVLKAVKKRDIELLHDFLPLHLRWIADSFSRVAHVK